MIGMKISDYEFALIEKLNLKNKTCSDFCVQRGNDMRTYWTAYDYDGHKKKFGFKTGLSWLKDSYYDPELFLEEHEIKGIEAIFAKYLKD